MGEPVYMLGFLMISFFLQLLSTANGEATGHQGKCPPSFECGYLKKIQFPFAKAEQPNCGIFVIQGCDNPLAYKTIQLRNHGRQFVVIHASQSSPYSITIRDDSLYKSLQSRSCNPLSHNYTLPISSPLASFQISFDVVLFRCNRTLVVKTPTLRKILNYSCGHYNIYYGPLINASRSSFSACSMIRLPVKDVPDAEDPFTFLTAEISIEVTLSPDCANCHNEKGHWQLDRNEKFHCLEGEKKALRLGLGLWLGLGHNKGKSVNVAAAVHFNPTNYGAGLDGTSIVRCFLPSMSNLLQI